MNHPIRIGLMGCGVVANYGHLPAIAGTSGLTLAALFDPNPEHLAATAAKFGNPPAFTDVDAFFRSGIDAVVVTSPAPAHIHNVRKAAEYKLPVLCEKPMALDDAEIVEMIDLMDRAGQPIWVGFTYRFSPAAVTIRELVQRNAIGTIKSLRLIYLWNLHGMYALAADGQRVVHPRYHGRMIEGGPIVDCGVHQIDLARWWLKSEVVRQHAVGVWVEDYDAPDHVYLHLDHQQGAHTLVEMSFTYGHTARETRPQFKYELIGTDGLILLDREEHRFELRTADGTQQLPYAGEKNFEDMFVNFRDALHSGDRSLLPTAADGLAATRIAKAAVEQCIRDRRRG